MRYVLLGATGDLAKSKIIPALARLYCEGALPEDFILLGVSRRPWKAEEYRRFVSESLENARVPGTMCAGFTERIEYHEADFESPDSLASLAQVLAPGDYIHLSIRPEAYQSVADALPHEKGARLIIEKPFGHDGASARTLDAALIERFGAEHIFRVDHYLGKEGVRGLPARMKAEGVPELIMSGRVQSIEVHLLESRDVKGRGAFYDATGVVRDVVQNHALEALAVALAPENSPAARASVLAQLALNPSETPKQGQYQGYREEQGVASDSLTPTAVSLPLLYTSGEREISVVIRAGKALKETESEIRFHTDTGVIAFPFSGSRAYEHLIAEALRDERAYFPSMAEISEAWRIVDPVIEKLSGSPIDFYTPGAEPL